MYEQAEFTVNQIKKLQELAMKDLFKSDTVGGIDLTKLAEDDVLFAIGLMKVVDSFKDLMLEEARYLDKIEKQNNEILKLLKDGR